MKSTALDGLFTWAEYQPERRIDFNGFFWMRENGNLLIDPMPLAAGGLEFVRERGGARWIVLTNPDHLRDSLASRETFGAELWAPLADRERFSGCDVSGWFAASDDLPDGLRDDVDVRWVHGGKCAAEAVLFLKPIRALLFGDVVRSHVSGELMLLKASKLADPARVRADLLALGDLDPRAILLGDGDSMFVGAQAAFSEFLRGLTG